MKYVLKITLICASLIAPVNAALAKDSSYLKRESAVIENMKFARRLENIAGPILIKNAAQCGSLSKPYIGVEFATQDSVGEAYGQIMNDLYGVGMHPTVTMIADQAPAAESLQLRDMVVSVNGKTLTEGKHGLWDLQDIIAASANSPLKLALKRDGQPVKITILPVSACNKSVRIINKSGHDVVVDEKKIGVTKGLLKSGKSDAEIAVRIEEELLDSLH